LFGVPEKALALTIDFSSGAYNLQGSTGLDTYTQDGYVVEIEETLKSTDKAPIDDCPGRWCWTGGGIFAIGNNSVLTSKTDSRTSTSPAS
jgi:hypothetical protein